MTEQLFGGALLIGLLASCWGRVKMLASRAVSLLIVNIKIDSGELASAVTAHCWLNLRRSPFGSRHYASLHDYVRPLRRRQAIAFETTGQDPVLFWSGICPLLIGWWGSGTPNDGVRGVSLTFLRGTWNQDKLLSDSLAGFNSRLHSGVGVGERRFTITRLHGRQIRSDVFGRNANDPAVAEAPGRASDTRIGFKVGEYRILDWKPSDLGTEIEGGDPWGALAYPVGVLQAVDECRRWLSSKSWYRSKCIPWRRGLLLYGPPGSGKTSLVRSVAYELDLPVFVFDLSNMSNEDLTRCWQTSLQSSPCVALFEDIDGVFEGRQNRLGKEGGGLSFDCFLNCLSGIGDSDGVLTFVTTNKIEDLDEALGTPTDRDISTRPGRIDRTVYLGAMDQECRERVACRILSDCPQHIDATVEAGDQDTGSQFTERCARLAQDEYWSSPTRNGVHRAISQASGHS